MHWCPRCMHLAKVEEAIRMVWATSFSATHKRLFHRQLIHQRSAGSSRLQKPLPQWGGSARKYLQEVGEDFAQPWESREFRHGGWVLKSTDGTKCSFWHFKALKVTERAKVIEVVSKRRTFLRIYVTPSSWINIRSCPKSSICPSGVWE